MVQARERSNQFSTRLEAVDRLQSAQRRLVAQRIDGCGVHARGVVVANLLLDGSPVGSLGVSLQDAPQELLIVIAELGVNAPPSLVSGDGIILHPAAAAELIEVRAGVNGA